MASDAPRLPESSPAPGFTSRIVAEVHRRVVGQEYMIERLLIGLLITRLGRVLPPPVEAADAGEPASSVPAMPSGSSTVVRRYAGNPVPVFVSTCAASTSKPRLE